MFPPILRYFLSFKFAPRVIERFILSPKSKFDLAIRSVLKTLLFVIPSVKYPCPNVEPTVPGLKYCVVLD